MAAESNSRDASTQDSKRVRNPAACIWQLREKQPQAGALRLTRQVNEVEAQPTTHLPLHQRSSAVQTAVLKSEATLAALMFVELATRDRTHSSQSKGSSIPIVDLAAEPGL